MAKIKISALSELADGSIATGDYIPIVDVSDTSQASSGTTKKVTITSLASGVASAFTNNDNPTFQTLTTTGAATIGTTLGSGAITSTGAITGTSLATSSNGALNIGTGTITSGAITSSGVGTFSSNTANFYIGRSDATNPTTSEGMFYRANSTTSHNFFITSATADTLLLSVATGNAPVVFYNYANGALAGYVVSNGASVTYNTSSDRKLKTNIQDLNFSIEEFKKIQPRKFNWKIDNSEDIGFIAQEVETLLPKLISVKDETYSLNYSGFISPLISVVQQLITRVETLESK